MNKKTIKLLLCVIFISFSLPLNQKKETNMFAFMFKHVFKDEDV